MTTVLSSIPRDIDYSPYIRWNIHLLECPSYWVSWNRVAPANDRTAYQIRFISINNLSQGGILAQSENFAIVAGGPDAGSESVSVISGTSTIVLGSATSEAATTAGTH